MRFPEAWGMTAAGFITAALGTTLAYNAGEIYDATTPEAREAFRIQRTLNSRELQNISGTSQMHPIFGEEKELKTRYDSLVSKPNVLEDIQTIEKTNAMGRSGTAFMGVGYPLTFLGLYFVRKSQEETNKEPSN